MAVIWHMSRPSPTKATAESVKMSANHVVSLMGPLRWDLWLYMPFLCPGDHLKWSSGSRPICQRVTKVTATHPGGTWMCVANSKPVNQIAVETFHRKENHKCQPQWVARWRQRATRVSMILNRPTDRPNSQTATPFSMLSDISAVGIKKTKQKKTSIHHPPWSFNNNMPLQACEHGERMMEEEGKSWSCLYSTDLTLTFQGFNPV